MHIHIPIYAPGVRRYLQINVRGAQGKRFYLGSKGESN